MPNVIDGEIIKKVTPWQIWFILIVLAIVVLVFLGLLAIGKASIDTKYLRINQVNCSTDEQCLDSIAEEKPVEAAAGSLVSPPAGEASPYTPISLRWIAAQQQPCIAACFIPDRWHAVTSGTDERGNPYYICGAQIANGGVRRPGYGQASSNICNVFSGGHMNGESSSSYECLCSNRILTNEMQVEE